jgi:hypothetical protein
MEKIVQNKVNVNKDDISGKVLRIRMIVVRSRI